MARSVVRRHGEGLSAEQVADKIVEAERRERETGQQLGVSVDRGPYDGDPQNLTEQWVSRHVEWRRVAALMDEEGWKFYRPEQDVQGSTCAREREDRRTDALARQAA
ncbi:hypothetical protein [Streptomyces sp. NPDC006285]|uniref:hypothetical protein n=1 Tax=Streptomyces sp. NPDC006285 TaxID=3364742 RepID=UPI003677E980